MIIGSSRTATVSGTTFQHMFGMRSSLYMIVGSRMSSPKLAPTAVVYKPSAAYATFPRRYESGSATWL